MENMEKLHDLKHQIDGMISPKEWRKVMELPVRFGKFSDMLDTYDRKGNTYALYSLNQLTGGSFGYAWMSLQLKVSILYLRLADALESRAQIRFENKRNYYEEEWFSLAGAEFPFVLSNGEHIHISHL